MVVARTLADGNSGDVKPKVVPKEICKTKGHTVCAHCDDETDIWLNV
jgi:hypothetical protein